MTVTIDLSPEREAQIKSYAESRKMSIEEVMLKGAEQLVPVESISHLQTTNPAEWARADSMNGPKATTVRQRF